MGEAHSNRAGKLISGWLLGSRSEPVPSVSAERQVRRMKKRQTGLSYVILSPMQEPALGSPISTGKAREGSTDRP